MIMIVIPNVMGMCIFSPKLDISSNSVRGLEFCKRFTERFRFHIFEGNLKLGFEKMNPVRKGLGETKVSTVCSLDTLSNRGKDPKWTPQQTTLKSYTKNDFTHDLISLQ